MEFWARSGVFVIAAALLFTAIKLQKSSNKKAKNVSVIAAFIAGLAALAAIAGDWMRAGAIGTFAVGGLIVCVCIIVVDWMVDKKPDRPAMYSAFALALMIVLGASNLPTVGDQISDGGSRVGEQMSKLDDGKPKAAK